MQPLVNVASMQGWNRSQIKRAWPFMRNLLGWSLRAQAASNDVQCQDLLLVARANEKCVKLSHLYRFLIWAFGSALSLFVPQVLRAQAPMPGFWVRVNHLTSCMCLECGFQMRIKLVHFLSPKSWATCAGPVWKIEWDVSSFVFPISVNIWVCLKP